MIFTNIYIDNFYSFSNSNLNLSFSRMPVDKGVLTDESLEGRDKFYFKKVNVITGANATGKTSLGKILLGIQIFITTKQFNSHYLKLCNKNKQGRIVVDFATSYDFMLNRIELVVGHKEGTEIVTGLMFGRVFIRVNDSCKAATARLDELFRNKKTNSQGAIFIHSNDVGLGVAIENFTQVNFSRNWHYIFSENEDVTTSLNDLDFNVLSKILKTFDSTIKEVVNLTPSKSKEGDAIDESQNYEAVSSGYAILFKNGDSPLINKDGKTTDANRFSRGTFESISVAHLLSRIISDKKEEEQTGTKLGTTYFLDEKLAYCHTELEKIILSLLVAKLPRHAQLFYTTHNYDVLDMSLPLHNFTFTRRTEEGYTEFIPAISLINKNDRSLSSAVKRNYFDTDPDSSILFSMLLDD